MQFTFSANKPLTVHVDLDPEEFAGMTEAERESAILKTLEEMEPGAWFEPWEVENVARLIA